MATTIENINHLDFSSDIDLAQVVVKEINEARDKFCEYGDTDDTRTMASIAIMDSFSANKGDLITEFVVEPSDKSEQIILHQGIKVGKQAIKQFVARNVASIGTIAEFINGDDVLIVHGDFEVKPISKAA